MDRFRFFKYIFIYLLCMDLHVCVRAHVWCSEVISCQHVVLGIKLRAVRCLLLLPLFLFFYQVIKTK